VPAVVEVQLQLMNSLVSVQHVVQLQLMHSLVSIQHVVRLLKSYFVLLMQPRLKQAMQVWQPPVVAEEAQLMRCSVARSQAAVPFEQPH